MDLIRERVPHIFPKDISKQPDKIFLLAGGNDAEDSTTDSTINDYDRLIRTILEASPHSKLILGPIPPRKNDPVVNGRISEVNDYLKDRGLRRDNVQFAAGVAPVDSNMFTKKLVHFNQKGKSLLASRLKPFLVD